MNFLVREFSLLQCSVWKFSALAFAIILLESQK